jgi:hypothetical protein
MNPPACHAAQNGWISSATSWLEKRMVIVTLNIFGFCDDRQNRRMGFRCDSYWRSITASAAEPRARLKKPVGESTPRTMDQASEPS